MDSFRVQIKKEFDDLPEDNPDMVDVEDLKNLKENNCANNVTNISFCSVNVKSEFKEDNENNCIAPENQLNTNKTNGIKEEYVNCNTNEKRQTKKSNEVKCEQCGVLCWNESVYKIHLMDHTEERPYKCDLCEKSYKKSSSLIYHMSSHTGSHEHHCEVCGKGFMVRSALQAHMPTHTKDKPFVCLVCGRGFSHASSLNTHKAVHSTEYHFECEQCDMKFKTKKALTRHSQKHEAKELQCEICSKIFESKVSLKVHLKTHRQTDDEGQNKVYSCDQCGNSYKCVNGFKNHMRHHTKDLLKCDICDKSYLGKKQLQIHLRTHTGEKPYECEICNKKFISKGYLDSHRSIHDSNRQSYKCDLCEKVLACKRSLRAHRLVLHSTEKKYQCKLCEKRFKIGSLLSKHIRRHHNKLKEVPRQADKEQDQQTQCHICNKYLKKSYLRIHLKQHTEDQTSFKCEICDTEFKLKCNLNRHMLIHQSDRKTYKCDLCDKVFQRSTSRRSHWIDVHSTENHQCKACGEKFQKYHELRRHRRMHEKKEQLVKNLRMNSNGTAQPAETDFSAEELKNNCEIVRSSLEDVDQEKTEIVFKDVKEEKKHRCKLCHERFKFGYELSRHLWRHKMNGEIIENDSGESNGVVQSAETDRVGEISQVDCCAEGLKEHVSTHDVKPFTCKCLKLFFSESEYKKHVKDDCEVVKSGLKLVEDFKVENDVKEELNIDFEGIKGEYSS